MAALFLIVAIPTTWAMVNYTAASLLADGDFEGDGHTVVLQPNTWVNQSFPLLKHIDIGDQLARGQWILMLYRSECPDCRYAIAQYVGLAHELAGRTGAPRVALIQVPPHPEGASHATTSGAASTRGRLTDAKRWVVQTPLFLRVDEKTVTTVAQSPELLLGEFGSSDFTAAEPQSTRGGFPDYRQLRRAHFLREIACGPLALIAVLQAQGTLLTPEQMDRIVAVAGSRGTDLLQLKELAESHGLHALGIEVSTSKLRTLGQTAIVHVNGIGFVAVIGYTEDGLRVVYPNRPPGIVPDDLFERAFGKPGKALLVTRAPVSTEQFASAPPARAKGPLLRPAKSMLPVGRVYTRDWQASLTIHNEGDELLSIKAIKSSCPVIKATVDQADLLPGQSTELRVNGTQTSLGSFICDLSLETNATGAQFARVPVRGYLEQAVAFEKPAVALNDRARLCS